MKTYELEQVVAKWFDYRLNLIVPNVSWGFTTHEMDLLVLTKSGCIYEVELKVSKSDLMADKKKNHNHEEYKNRTKYIYFAVPQEIADVALSVVDSRFGVLSAEWYERKAIPEMGIGAGQGYRIVEKRKPRKLSDYRATQAERQKLLELCAMRVWNLKKKVGQLLDRNKC